MPRQHRLLLPLAASLLLAAPAAARADCPGAGLRPTAATTAAVRAAVVCLANAERAVAGRAPLTPERRLGSAARAFAGRMVAQRFFAHVAPDGTGLVDRLAAYDGLRTAGENIAWGAGPRASARATVASWMRSPGHRANLLSPAFQELGVGVAVGSPERRGPGAATWVVDFGRRSAGAAAVVAGSRAAPPVSA